MNDMGSNCNTNTCDHSFHVYCHVFALLLDSRLTNRWLVGVLVVHFPPPFSSSTRSLNLSRIILSFIVFISITWVCGSRTLSLKT